ncbi:MAG: NUDIX hydrolase, partial [Acidimicrobiales bacterium]
APLPVPVPAPAPVPVPAPVAEPGSAGASPSAVLVALFEEEGEARVLLTRRAVTLRTHQGQVSFPGGRIEPGEDAVAAALREALEEIDLDPALARPLAFLPPASAFVSGTPITPVVATLDRRPGVLANPVEVARVFDVSLADLAAAYTEERWSEPGLPPFSMYFFEVDGETVWGATARMLVDLLAVVLGAS